MLTIKLDHTLLVRMLRMVVGYPMSRVGPPRRIVLADIVFEMSGGAKLTEARAHETSEI
jgi:hypothetical protein